MNDLSKFQRVERLEAEVERIRRDTIEACAQIADGFTCGGCGMDGKAGAAIRLLAKLPPGKCG